MIEVIASAYIGSLLLSILIMCLSLWKVRRQFRAGEFFILTKNLAKVGLYWSVAKSDFVHLKPNSLENDKSKAKGSILKMMGFFSILGVLGLILNLVMAASIFYFARPRLEKAIYRSPLCQNENLSDGTVGQLVDELRKAYN